MEIGNQALFVVHGTKRRRRIGFRQIFQQRPGAAYGAFHLPESVAAVKLRVPSTQCRVPENSSALRLPSEGRE